MDLKTARTNKNLTQIEAANLVGVRERAWRRWEKKEHPIHSSSLLKVQEVLGLSDSETLQLLRIN